MLNYKTPLETKRIKLLVCSDVHKYSLNYRIVCPENIADEAKAEMLLSSLAGDIGITIYHDDDYILEWSTDDYSVYDQTPIAIYQFLIALMKTEPEAGRVIQFLENIPDLPF